MLEILQKKRELLMKKVLAVLMTLVLAVTLCVPSFAANDDTTAPADDITAVIEEILGSILGSEGTVDVDAVLEALSGLLGGSLDPDSIVPEISQPIANQVVNALAAAGMTKADLEATFDQMLADGQISDKTHGYLMNAVEALPDDGSQGGIIDDAQAAEIAGQILSALNALGVTNDQIIEALDSMNANGTLPDEVYDAIIKQINAAENTTAADPGTGDLGGLLGGVGDFFGGIFDTIGGLLGFGGGDDNGGSGNNTTAPENAGEYGGSDPTGDTAVFAVVGVAAVAGAALLLTRKKKSDK